MILSILPFVPNSRHKQKSPPPICSSFANTDPAESCPLPCQRTNAVALDSSGNCHDTSHLNFTQTSFMICDRTQPLKWGVPS